MRAGPDGASQLATWEHAAARGSEVARRKLEGEPFPEAVGYLWRWALELYGRSGATQYGLSPLSYTTIRDWATLTYRFPEPREVDVLIQLDAILRDPAPKEDVEEVKPTPPWPEKKNDG